ncbi:MAG: hypothetical protein AAF458_10950 [Pseudomonadota bacterium]
MGKVVVTVALAAVAGSAMHLMQAGSIGGGTQAELSAMLLSILFVIPLFSGWLES